MGVPAPHFGPSTWGCHSNVLKLDTVRREACWHARVLPLSGPAFELLALLARCPGEPLPSTQLMRALWPNRHVDPANLRIHVATLRRHLGADALRTVRGRGYALTVPAHTASAQAPGHRHPGPGPTSAPLPWQPDELIGREDCLQQLAALLQQHRLVSVLGPGGIGKTRVAQQLAHQLQGPALPGGVWWVDLAPLAPDLSAARLCQATAAGMGLQWPAGGDEQAARRLGQVIQQASGEAPALLVLDNAEHLIHPLATLLPGLLAAAPALRVLLTSQHALAVPVGQALWLQPLAVPEPDASAADILASPAAQLLLRRAHAVHPHWQPAADEWPAIATLVRALDGVALALELAAARLPLLGAAALHERLAHRLQALGNDRGHATGVPPRHRTLRAALDWSHALLPPAEQAALAQVAVFGAPFRLHAAVATLRIDDLDAAGLEGAVQGLVAWSMLQLLPAGAQGAPARLRLAETTRLYAWQALQAQGAAAVQACEQRHGQAMAALARQACDDFLAASDAVWSARWLPDLEDFQRAFDRAHERGDAEVAADLIEALVLSANITGRNEPALQRWQATRKLAEQATPRARAKLLGWGNLAQTPGTTRLMQSARRLQAWREVPGEEGRRGLCVALAMHTVASQDAGEPAAADAALAECLALESPGWPARLRRRCGWIALTRLAIVRDDEALLARAGRLSARMAAELQHLGAWRERTLVQGQQALMLRLRGRARAAADLLSQVARTQLQLGCGLDAGRSLALQCAALVEQVDGAATSAPSTTVDIWQAVRPVAARALTLLEPYPSQIAHVAEALADLAARQGEPELAVHLLAGAEQMRQSQQLGRDRLTDEASRRAWQQARALLDAASLDRCVAQGRELSPEALRMLALRWLVSVDAG